MALNEDKTVTIGDITKKEVRIMVKRHHDFSKKHPEYQEKTHVKCVWFPIDEIEYIYKQSIKEGADGIRVYFGNYPEKDLSGKLYPNPHTNTVVFVSTKNGHQDYFTEEIYEMSPENRGEQCYPTCTGVEFKDE